MNLRRYDEEAAARSGLKRFQWVRPGAVARSSQPNYGDSFDEEHGFDQALVDMLMSEGIKVVVSANWKAIDPESRGRLEAASIGYHHFPVRDGSAPTVLQLMEASKVIEANPAALVYCGYGQGRTGTFIAAWALVTQQPGMRREEDWLQEWFGVETELQLKVLLGL